MAKGTFSTEEGDYSSASDFENVGLSASSEIEGEAGVDWSGSEKDSGDLASPTTLDREPISRVLSTGRGAKKGEMPIMAEKIGDLPTSPSRGEGKGKEKIEGSASMVRARRGGGEERSTSGLRIPVKSCLGTEKGWLDVNKKFVRSPSNMNREDYFRSYGVGCYFRPTFGIIPDSTLNHNLEGLEYINKLCNFDSDYIEEVRYAFQIPMEYEIRAATEGEKIYHKGGDVWVGIPLDHFRARLRLPLHRFIHSLLVGMRLGIGQIGPNSIRKICAFVARCAELNLEPTLMLF